MIRSANQNLIKKLCTVIKTICPAQNSRRTTSKMSEVNGKFKVLVTHPETPQAAIDLLKKDCEVIICEKLPPERIEALEKCSGVDAILWATSHKLNDEVLDASGDRLKAISAMTSGIDYVDTDAMKRRKILLGHTPVVVNDPVADLTVALMVSAARRFHEGRLKIET